MAVGDAPWRQGDIGMSPTQEYDHVESQMEYPDTLDYPHQHRIAPRPITVGTVAGTCATKCTARPGDMIRVVIFDWGGVLMRTVDASPRLAWDARLGLEPGSVNRLVFASPAWRRAQLGQISDAAFWADLGVRLNLSPDALAEFRRDFWAGDRLDGDLVAFIRSLRPRVKTALLSNFSTQLRQLLTQHGLIDAFDVIVISGEEGILKPDARIYHLAAERLGVPVADCLFVDDSEENVAGARAAGMQALQFVSFSPFVLCLSELGVVL